MSSLIWKEDGRLLNRDSCIFPRFVQGTRSGMEWGGRKSKSFFLLVLMENPLVHQPEFQWNPTWEFKRSSLPC
jgi:hypothetical protein